MASEFEPHNLVRLSRKLAADAMDPAIFTIENTRRHIL